MRRNSTLAPARRKVRPRVPDAVRAEVKARTHGRCHLCLWRGASRRQAQRIAHVHHVFPVQRWPELAKLAANLIGMCNACHMGHEYPGCKPTRIPREALPAEALALADGHGPRTNYLERTYPLTAAGRTPAPEQEATSG